ncbi:hypothetical protein ACEWY4_022700 [Coilia grayii]|uniref:MHC class I-like antigen recognition-like domain-containing protein n=1 Tax=Coilia grayii TaxID=363190 RepID=A0ABD1J1A6_9TELE
MSTTTFASGTQPSFQQTTALNGMLLWHCDSVTRPEECKCPWVARSMSAEDRDKKNTLCAIESYEMEDLIAGLCVTVNCTSDVLQRGRGCAVSSDGSLLLYDRWGLRGEDFLSFDPEGLRWAELSPLASPVAQLWEGQRHMKEEFRSFLLNECQLSLQRLIQEWRAQNNTQEKTDVHVFARAGPGPGVVSLVCHVTHTESSGLLVQLRDRGNMLGPRPNGDGTFQQRLTADITADIVGDHTAVYQCNVQTKSKHIFVKWDGRTGGVSSVRPPDSSCCSCAFQVVKFLPWALLCLLMGSLPLLLICSAKLGQHTHTSISYSPSHLN